MNVDIALFFHICGVLILFGSALVEITSLVQLRRTTTVAVARAWSSLSGPLELTFPISAVVLIGSGLYMLHEDFAVTQPWAMTVLTLLVVLMVLGAAVNGQRTKAIDRALEKAPDGPIPADIDAQIHDRLLLTSIHSMSGAILGAILIMCVKPGLRDSIIIAALSMILGGLAVQPMANTQQARPILEPVAAGAAEAD